MNILVTGCNGLIGSEAVLHFDRQGCAVTGIDNNMRRQFFGPAGDTTWNLERLKRSAKMFRFTDIDIRDRAAINHLFQEDRFDLIIHCAAQPSHDKAREIPLVDFDVNAVGTINLLEATRQHAPEAVFVFMSTNKVYGDAPNELPLVELEMRYDYSRPEDRRGIDENCRIDRSLHSLFGASKAAADLVAQEYGRYFGMKVGVFRGGCLTGPAHSAVELHGFLSYLVRVALSGDEYTIYGYKGKQVRDQIHSQDVVRAFEAFASNPRPGEVYNLGGGRDNSASILECISLIEELTERPLKWRYVDANRVGDHICYISDLTKLKSHYPHWSVTRSLREICTELIESQRKTARATRASVVAPASPVRRRLQVSVITPAYNQAVFLPETIDSVLSQDYSDMDYRVIDDGSTDDTQSVLARYDGKFRCERHANRGQTPTINKGWEQATGDVLTWLNSDDTFLPGAVSKAVEYLEHHPEVGIVFGDTLFTQADGTPIARSKPQTGFDYEQFVMRCENPIAQPSAFIRRSVIEDVGALDPHYYYFMDWDFWLRAGIRHHIAYVPELLSTYRLHAESKTVAQAAKAAPELMYMYTNYFGRPDVPEPIRRNRRLAWANMCFTSGAYYLKGGNRAEGARMALQAASCLPSLLLRPRLAHKFLYCTLGEAAIYSGSRKMYHRARAALSSSR